MPNANRRCRQCKEYKPVEECIKVPLGYFCSSGCASEYGLSKHKAKQEKAKRADHKKAKEKLKTRSDWLREAQIAFNQYIRLRDHGQPCISCGNLTGCKMNAGHYLTVGAHPELRFEELNCSSQCEHCNSFLSGNQVRYRQRLIEKIGEEKVLWLEGPHDPKKYTIDDIKAIKTKYSELSKQLKKKLDL